LEVPKPHYSLDLSPFKWTLAKSLWNLFLGGRLGRCKISGNFLIKLNGTLVKTKFLCRLVPSLEAGNEFWEAVPAVKILEAEPLGIALQGRAL